MPPKDIITNHLQYWHRRIGYCEEAMNKTHKIHLSCFNQTEIVKIVSGNCYSCAFIALCSFILISCLVITSRASAAEIPKTEHRASIQTIPNNKTLTSTLQSELTLQRKVNERLKLYSTPGKIALYEKELLQQRLKAEGYYAAKIKSTIGKKIRYTIHSGPIYTIDKIDWNLPQSIALPKQKLLTPGDTLKAQKVLDQKQSLLDYIKNEHCFYKIDLQYHVTIFHATASADITFTMADSLVTEFAQIEFTGNKSVRDAYLRRNIPIQSGDCYQEKKLSAAKLALLHTDLISRVNVVEDPPGDNGVPIIFELEERNHRSLSFGVGYRDEEGIGISTGWQHRNLLGQGEHATLGIYIAQRRQAIESELVIDDYYRPGQQLTLFTDVEREETDAFDTTSADAGALLSRFFGRYLRAEAGVQIDFARIEQNDSTDDVALLSLPLRLDYDRRNSPLDPTKGWALGLASQPFWDLYNTQNTFVKNSIAASVYYQFRKRRYQPTIAVRAATGSINGSELIEIPATERFYVGGGGSVRGYRYQTLGPAIDNEPIGGLSFTEVSTELRIQLNDTWGGVLFVDGGYAYEDEVPSLGQDLHWGAGVGIRFYTDFAPIRADIGFPLDKRDEIDDDFQIYFSIGQAF